ncbi:MAG: hypothetical protein GX089_09780 [Fibrobacter sp.]|nr:hypothetical protein [Fibrobacter sp.]
MRAKLIEHVSGLLFVTAVLLLAMFVFYHSRSLENKQKGSRVESLLDVPVSNVRDPFQRALVKDLMNIFYPGQAERNAVTTKDLLQIKEDQFNAKLQKSHLQEQLSFSKFTRLGGMFFKFIFVYVFVMILTYYGVQTLAILRFVSRKQHQYHKLYGPRRKSVPKQNLFLKMSRSVLKGIMYFILFSPAYVIAYSMRTEFNTDSIIFMILLAVISNGLLVMYSNKFHAFLTSESRKGYVETAIVKNLYTSWDFNCPDGISLKSILSPKKNFKGHVFEHIFRNAKFQYLSTIKEQASFLITGLVIIEMALNIHGYLNYEMLRQILYKNYDIVIFIILGIFYVVKVTEILTDILTHRENMKYENRQA